MSLFVKETDTFEVVVCYVEKTDGTIAFHLEKEASLLPNIQRETFVFKKPKWSEAKLIMSSSVLMNAANGQALVDPYKLMDIKLKTMLKDWSLKGEDGEKVPVTGDNFDNLHPDLIQHLFDRVGEALSPSEPEPEPEPPTEEPKKE